MSRRQNRVSPLTLVLPAPSLPRKRSSMLSTSSIGSAPRTPRSACASPACASWILNPSNRKSSDSWNSSNNDFGDEGEAAEWKSDHILLLSRTLDALPSHLVTPFHGPIPPSNLLDKIARGIAQAKGPVEWPFSLRATRVKLIEIARAKSKDDSPNENDGPVPSPAKRRALYRQSSMDFIHESASEDQHGVESINRLSTRLQRTIDCVADAHQSFHPYSRTRSSTRITQRRSSSPPRPSHLLSLINPATPSTSTLTTLSSVSSRSHHRRSGGTLTSMTSNESMSSLGLADAKIPYPLLPSTMTSAPDPRVQRVRRSESFCGPMSSRDSLSFLPPASPISTRHTLKRAPSYGAMAQESKEVNRARAANDGLPVRGNSPCPSSDEEEKLRTKYAKKARTKTGNGISNAVPLLASPDEKTKTVKKCKESIQTRPKDQTSPAPTGKSPARQRMNLQRNPSIFGDELPCLHIAGPALSPGDEPPSSSPQTPKKVHTLRRVKRLGLAPSRKLSFGAGGPALDGGNDADAEDELDRPLASGFQLR